MTPSGEAVSRYQFEAQIRDGVVVWRFGVMTESGGQHAVELRHGEEVPILLDLLRHDATVYFDPQSRTLRTGWNVPGKPAAH